MRILLLGAGGFIGRHILAELTTHGHEVVSVDRSGRPGALALDLASPIDWTPHVQGIDLIINAAGVLRGPTLRAVHVDTPRALYAAAARAGVGRTILISAISARPDVPTDYARTKLQGEDVLRKSGLAWTILRPSLVYADGSYGGTSLLRGLAALPWCVPLPGDGTFAFTPIHAADLARTVRRVAEDDRFAGHSLEPVGPETLDLATLLTRYRAWLGFPPAPFLSIPLPVMRLLGRAGDRLGSGPVSSNSLRQMIAGNAGDPAAFVTAIGLRPRSLDQALADHPAHVQDRWHARLYFVVPALRAILALLWFASALLGLTQAAPQTQAVVDALGLPAAWAGPLRIGTSLADVAIGILVLADRTGRWSTPVQFCAVIGYSLGLSLALPGLWLDPLGPLLKNLPVLALILVAGAVGSRR